MEYSGWKQLDKIDIVYSVNSTVEHKGKTYKKAYIVESGNTKAHEKSLTSAKAWACGYSRDKIEPTIIQTENKDFSFQIISAAGKSWSQGGKLSFWMCIVEKKDIEPFAVGINADILCDLILESTMYNGGTKEKVFFARKNGQLGVLHENMPSYKELLKDQEIKKNINKGKTSKWKIGYSYKTLTQEDIMYGYFKPIVSTNHKDDYILYTLDFNAKFRPYYTSTYTKEGLKDFKCYINHLPAKCPARQEGSKIFDETPNYYNEACSKIIEYCKSEFKEDRFHFHDDYVIYNLPEVAFALFSYSPEKTIELLAWQRDIVQKRINDINANIMTDRDKSFYRDTSRFTVDSIVYNHRNEYLKINYDYQTVSFYKDIIGFYNKLIEIAEIEKNKKNA